MREEVKRLLMEDSPALGALCERLLQAADCIVTAGRASTENGEAFIYDHVVERFNIDPAYEWSLMETITALVREHPLVNDLKAKDDGYYIKFQQMGQDAAPAESKTAIGRLVDKITGAVDCIVKEALSNVKDGEAFVSDNVLAQFDIDPMRDLLVTDAIVELLGEHPLGFSFDADIHGYRFYFQQIEALPNAPDGIFEYGGWHFVPHRKLNQGDGDFQEITRSLASNRWMGLCDYGRHQKFPYQHGAFFAASTDKECDIFRCLEDGRLYIPGEHELFLYTKPEEVSELAGETEPPGCGEDEPER